jgi:radical SAM protein with 4Fe4S-binding SPASM domain
MEKKESPLKWVAWETTKECNLNCVHCRSGAGSGDFKGVSTKEGFILMDKLARFATPVFVLSGGEPLLRPDIFELAKYGTSLGFKMAMATNGSLIDDAACENMKKSGIKIVALSLDGPNAAVHDDFRRQKGSFDSIMNAVEKFKKHSIEFIINSSFTKRNQEFIEQTYKLAKKSGAKAWYMFLVVPMGRGADLLGELITPEDYEKILKWHYEAEIKEDNILMRPTCAPSYYRIYAQQQKEKGGATQRRSLSYSPGGGRGCVAARSIAYISAEGDVYPCSYFTCNAGNIFKTPLAEIWESELFKGFRTEEGYDNCGCCEYRNSCGGCRARALIYTDDMKANDPYCDHIPAVKKGNR